MTVLRAAIPFLLVAFLAVAAESRYVWRTVAHLSHPPAGYAVEGATLFTWGNGIELRPLPDGAAQQIVPADRSFGEGGCLLDVDGDGLTDLVLNQKNPDALVWYRAPQWTRRVIDTGVDAPDIIAATLFGRRGVLLIHKRQQVRFYAVPESRSASWPVRDIYSVYTPSWQGGLAAADIDGDGRTDILCGNYWIRAPESFDLPWRLFAINTWTEEEASGMMRLAWNGGLGVAQRLLENARVAWFEKPADPTQLWTVRVLGGFDRPNSLEGVDLDGSGHAGLLLAENGGRGRVLYLRGNDFEARELRVGPPVRFAHALAGGDLLVFTAGSIEYGRPAR